MIDSPFLRAFFRRTSVPKTMDGSFVFCRYRVLSRSSKLNARFHANRGRNFLSVCSLARKCDANETRIASFKIRGVSYESLREKNIPYLISQRYSIRAIF